MVTVVPPYSWRNCALTIRSHILLAIEELQRAQRILETELDRDDSERAGLEAVLAIPSLTTTHSLPKSIDLWQARMHTWALLADVLGEDGPEAINQKLKEIQ